MMGPVGPRVVVSPMGGHWVARVQRVEVGACGAVGTGGRCFPVFPKVDTPLRA